MMDKHGHEIFGLMGALLSLSVAERVIVVTAAASIAAGVSCAYIAAPIITELIDPRESIRESVNAGIGGILGISGLPIVAAIYASARTIKDWAPELVKKFLNRKTGL